MIYSKIYGLIQKYVDFCLIGLFLEKRPLIGINQPILINFALWDGQINLFCRKEANLTPIIVVPIWLDNQFTTEFLSADWLSI